MCTPAPNRVPVCRVLLCAAGVGAGRGRDDEWVDQQAAFEEVLSQLHQQHPQGRGQEGVWLCPSICLSAFFSMSVMFVCSAFRESSQWREQRWTKLFD